MIGLCCSELYRSYQSLNKFKLNLESNSRRLLLCVGSNALLLLITLTLIFFFDDGQSKYWRVGPQDDLVLISVQINTISRYWCLVSLIGFFKIAQCIVSEVAHPIISFNIYNPDKKVIDEFTKTELQIYGNTMYLIDAIRESLTIIISISQIDIALWGVLFSEGASILTIRWLLNQKDFVKTSMSSGIYCMESGEMGGERECELKEVLLQR